MFELIILNKGKYRNDIQIYQYSSIYNLMNELKKWLDEKKITENQIYNIRWCNKNDN